MSTMESTMLKHERMHFDSREAEAIGRMVLSGSGGLIYLILSILFPFQSLGGKG